MESGSHDANAVVDSTSKQQLVNGCLYCLSQCSELIERASGADYARSDGVSSSIGSHMRHILDRYQSLLAGLPSRMIDYDARKRDREIEVNSEAASFAIASLSRRLTELCLADVLGQAIKVRETVYHMSEPVEVASTVERELMSLVSHSIHHLAIISMLAQGMGYQLDKQFGKAPSTIVFEQARL